MTSGNKKINVLIVDGSAVARKTLSDILSTDPDIIVSGIAADPFAAARRIGTAIPDVIILDMLTPRMDGMTFLAKLMAQHPIPVIISLPPEEVGGETVQQALALGALDILFKPQLGATEILTGSASGICAMVKEAAKHARARPAGSLPAQQQNPTKQKLSADVILPPPSGGAITLTSDILVCIGASTGGTESIYRVLSALSRNAPGIVIVQHMPEYFTASFARRLNDHCQISVKEAVEGDIVSAGKAFIAPGGHHTLVTREDTHYVLHVVDGPPVSRHRPSVDVLFRSAACTAGPNAVGIIMTGMGDDGATGLMEMKRAGAKTIAQDEESSIVFGMPKEAIARGAADRVLPLTHIAAEIMATIKN